MAATACSGIQNARNAEVNRMPFLSDTGLFPNGINSSNASRFDNPVLINPADRINAPKIKNTAELPNSENASNDDITPSTGSATIAKRPVTASGSAPVIHKLRHRKNAPKAFCPGRDNPSSVGVETAASARRIPATKIKRFTRSVYPLCLNFPCKSLSDYSK